MIRVKNLSFGYGGGEIIKDVSLDIMPRELCALIGPSGCGKTTFIKILSKIIKNFSGEICYASERGADREFSIGYVPQNYGLLPWKSVEENICLPLRLRGEKGDIGPGAIGPVAESLEIDGLLKKYPRELSGGQKQRAALARAILSARDLLLLDEPFSALDMLTAQKAQELFLRVWSEHQVSALFITHNVYEAVNLAKRILVMNRNGNIFEYTDMNEKDKLLNLFYNL
ncbi:MAG: ATP-binding cassette domain-containing protein [Spirochaetaceae bacterium]|nr:ATP-binding cassette domain-containing protein [Spirochaetaceae bacterium]